MLLEGETQLPSKSPKLFLHYLYMKHPLWSKAQMYVKRRFLPRTADSVANIYCLATSFGPKFRSSTGHCTST